MFNNSNVIIKTDKFSVVIPTMWRSDTTIDLLNRYEKCECVDEIIVIDNNKNNRPSGLDGFSKIKIIESQENLYVNKSWNIGVHESRNDLIAISNDDILFKPEDVFSFVSNIDGWGAIGMAYANFQNVSSSISIEHGNDIGYGWGCLIFVKKSQWVDIPDSIKIWFGDNWVVKSCEENRLPVMKLMAGGLIQTKMSTTSGDTSFSDVIYSDILEWEKIK
jgi:GT2 family glycosyltransferase